MSSSVDTDSFGASAGDLYRLHAGAAYQVARSITRNADDANDAVAEAFAGVFEAMSAGRLRAPDTFRPYLLAATRNASVDILRRAGRQTPTGEAGTLDGMASAAGPSDRLVAREEGVLVSEAFAELPARWRAVLWLTEVERLPPREAAVLLRCTPNTVAQLAVRARARLRQQYVQRHVRNSATGDCLEATEHLGGLVAGELTTVQANRVRGHLAECADCRARRAELDDLQLPQRRSGLALPLLLLDRLRGRLRSAAGRRRNPHWLSTVDPSAPSAIAELAGSPAVQHLAGGVTAALLALGLGAAIVRDADPRPPDAPALAPAVTADAPAAATPTTTEAPATTTTTTVPAAVPTTSAGPAAAAFVPAGPLARAPASLVAHALVAALPVYDRPGAPSASLTLANPRRSGAPLVLLVTAEQPGWLEVLLPVRPNGSTGWIRAEHATLVTHEFRIIVELGAHRLTAYRGTRVILSEPVALGTTDAPTPGGLYFTTELIQPVDRAGNVDPSGPYGPYAYGLSGFSEVIFQFGDGDGQFGIHGTNDPATLGSDVSHGCIRMSNEGITRLAQTLPLGVPVEIRP